MANTVLCYRLGRPNSLVRVDVDLFNQENEAAHEAGEDHPWIKADEDAESDGNTFEQCSKAEQKTETERQEKRAAEIAAENDEAE